MLLDSDINIGGRIIGVATYASTYTNQIYLPECSTCTLTIICATPQAKVICRRKTNHPMCLSNCIKKRYFYVKSLDFDWTLLCQKHLYMRPGVTKGTLRRENENSLFTSLHSTGHLKKIISFPVHLLTKLWLLQCLETRYQKK